MGRKRTEGCRERTRPGTRGRQASGAREDTDTRNVNDTSTPSYFSSFPRKPCRRASCRAANTRPVPRAARFRFRYVRFLASQPTVRQGTITLRERNKLTSAPAQGQAPTSSGTRPDRSLMPFPSHPVIPHCSDASYEYQGINDTFSRQLSGPCVTSSALSFSVSRRPIIFAEHGSECDRRLGKYRE